jgi:hypothetical protein
MDDLDLTGNNIHKINPSKGLLYDKFGIKDMRDLKIFLGLELAGSAKGIS